MFIKRMNIIRNIKMDEFYIVLPSNVKDTSNKNTISSYKTKLPKRIQLKGNWEVAMTEISYPRTFFNIEKDQIVKLVTNDSSEYWDPGNLLKAGHYKLDDLVMQINKIIHEELSQYKAHIKRFPKFEIKFNRVNLKMGTVNGSNLKIGAIISRHLAEVLGYRSNDHPNFISIASESPSVRNISAKEPPDMTAGVRTLYVYCDLIKHKIVGDVEVQLLRTVKIDKDSDPIVISYSNPQYNPLATNEFDSVELEIKSDLGSNIIFSSGKTICTLHFKRVYKDNVEG